MKLIVSGLKLVAIAMFTDKVKLTGIGADYIKKIASKSNISLSYQSV